MGSTGKGCKSRRSSHSSKLKSKHGESSEILSRIEKQGPICRPRNTNHVPLSRNDDIDFGLEIESNDAMWLFNDSSSPSVCYTGYRLINLNCSVEKWIHSWLSPGSEMAPVIIDAARAEFVSDRSQIFGRRSCGGDIPDSQVILAGNAKSVVISGCSEIDRSEPSTGDVLDCQPNLAGKREVFKDCRTGDGDDGFYWSGQNTGGSELQLFPCSDSHCRLLRWSDGGGDYSRCRQSDSKRSERPDSEDSQVNIGCCHESSDFSEILAGNDERCRSVSSSEASELSSGVHHEWVSDDSQSFSKVYSMYETSCEIKSLNRIIFSLLPLMDLDSAEDSTWVIEEGLDFLNPGFPSPCRKLNPISKVSANEGKNHLSAFATLDLGELRNFCENGPLFWPFQQKIYWASEDAWNCFPMSPCKDTMKLLTHIGTPCRSEEIKPGKGSHKSECRRRLAFGSGCNLVPETPPNRSRESRGKNKKKSMSKRRANKSLMKVVPLESEDGGNVGEDDLRQADLAIEKLLGIREFDGHEGVGTEFNVEGFTLDHFSDSECQR